MATSGIVDINASGTTAIDVAVVSTASGTVNRQMVGIGDSAAGSAYAVVGNATPAGTEYALFVRQVGALTANIGTVPALTKGTQGSTGFSVQDLKDSGRNVSTWFTVAATASAATETILSLTGYRSGAQVAASSSGIQVTSGKTFRITSIQICYVGILTAGYVRVSLRVNSTGSTMVSAPVVGNWFVGTTAALGGACSTVTFDVPDGIEIPSASYFVLTMIGYGATGTATAVGSGSAMLYGYEY